MNKRAPNVEPFDAKITYFIKAARFATFREAASRIGLTQAALSIAIRNLEGQLGAKLFERSKTGVRLTTRGAKLLRIFENSRDDVHRRVRDALDAAGNDALRIGAVTHFGIDELTPLLQRHRAKLPPVQLVFGYSLHNLEAVRKGALDFAFITWTNHPRDVQFVLLRDDPKAIVGARRRFAHIAKARTRAELADEPWVLQPKPQFDFRELLARDQAGYVVHDMHAQRELILRGLAIGEAQLSVFRPDELRRLVVSKAPLAHRSPRLYAVYGADISDSARRHLMFLIDEVRALGARSRHRGRSSVA